MKRRNYIEIREFILLGLSDDPQFHVVSCVFLLTTYMLSITGNLTINHPNPDGCSPTDPHVFLPQKFFHIRGVIHNCHCTQIPYHHYYKKENLFFCWLYDSLLFFSILLRVIEFCLLAAKSSDHYIAICK